MAKSCRWSCRRFELPLLTATGNLWVSFLIPYTYVFDQAGEKIRTVQFRAAGMLAPTSMFFNARGRLLVTPGCYQFEVN